MAKTGAQRQAEHREKQKQVGCTERINLMVSKEAKHHLECLTERYSVTQRQLLETLLKIFYDNQRTAKVHAMMLLAKSEGDHDKARKNLLRKLKTEYPGFSPDGKETSKGEKFYSAQREYTAIGYQLCVLQRNNR